MLQVQMAGRQTAVDTLRKTAESLLASDGDLLSNPDEIQESVGEQRNPVMMRVYLQCRRIGKPWNPSVLS